MIVIMSKSKCILKKCELIKRDRFYSFDLKYLDAYDLSIVYDNDQEQYYVIDNKTHLILSTHLSINYCLNWLDRAGYELIELKRKYDSKRYVRDIYDCTIMIDYYKRKY